MHSGIFQPHKCLQGSQTAEHLERSCRCCSICQNANYSISYCREHKSPDYIYLDGISYQRGTVTLYCIANNKIKKMTNKLYKMSHIYVCVQFRIISAFPLFNYTIKHNKICSPSLPMLIIYCYLFYYC